MKDKLIYNLITVHSGDLKKALSSMQSESHVFDFEKILPVPQVFKKMTVGSMFYFALAGHIKSLNLSQIELEKLLEPITVELNIDPLNHWYLEHQKVLKLRYDGSGNLREPEIYAELPLKVDDYIESGKSAFNCLKEYGVITDLAWKKKYWGHSASPEQLEILGNNIYFESYVSVGAKAIKKWALDHGLTMTVKCLNQQKTLWSISEYDNGVVKKYNDFVQSDLVGIINSFTEINKI